MFKIKLVKIINDLKEILVDIKTMKIDDVKIAPPISESELEKIEYELEFKFPKELRDIYIQEVSMIKFKWWMDKSMFCVNCKSGELYLLSPTNIRAMYKDIIYEVQQAKENSEFEEDEGLQAIAEDWLYWIPIIKFSNGDAFCIDKRNLQVVFLEHDVMDAGPSVHGTMIARSFDEMISKWSKIAFVDIYDWYEVCDADGLDIDRDQFKKIKEMCLKVE